MTNDMERCAVTSADGARVVLAVDGMTCGSCERHVRDALLKVTGVVDAVVDRTRAKAEVQMAGAVDPSPLVDAVRRAGYDATISRAALGQTDAAGGTASTCHCCGA